jgi:hypothetical protein
MRKLNLQLFATYTVTVYKDDHMNTATASPNSSVATDADVTLTLTPATGYEVDQIIVLSGGVTVDKETKKFKMGTANVVLAVTSKKSNLYRVTETCDVYINGAKTRLNKNVEVVLTKQGGICDVNCVPAEVTVNDAVQSLIDQGILVKI